MTFRRELEKEWDFPGDSVVKNPPANVGDVGSVPGSGRSSGEGKGNPLFPCLGSLMDRGAWCYSPWSCKSDMTKQLNNKNPADNPHHTPQSILCIVFPMFVPSIRVSP